jgi:tellurium resistance protein TerZ
MSISLAKGDKINLEKTDGSGYTSVKMGLGWKAGGWLSGGDVDLDASCLIFNKKGKLIDQVWFRQLVSKDKNIKHSGDDRVGAGSGDNEVISVDLSSLKEEADKLIFVVNNFTGQTFSSVKKAFCRLVDSTNNAEIAKYDLSCQGDHTAMVMAKLERSSKGWKMEAIGENCHGRTFHDMMPLIESKL